MAQLVEPYEGLPEYDPDQYDDYREYSEAEKAAFNALRKEAPGSPEEGLEGAMLKFHVADGYAHYRVVDTDPLKIQHVPYLDGYQIPAAHVRGLRREDVISQMENPL